MIKNYRDDGTKFSTIGVLLSKRSNEGKPAYLSNNSFYAWTEAYDWAKKVYQSDDPDYTDYAPYSISLDNWVDPTVKFARYAGLDEEEAWKHLLDDLKEMADAEQAEAKINENMKVTLTLGQLKRLVKEARFGFADRIRKEINNEIGYPQHMRVRETGNIISVVYKTDMMGAVEAFDAFVKLPSVEDARRAGYSIEYDFFDERTYFNDGEDPDEMGERRGVLKPLN